MRKFFATLLALVMVLSLMVPTAWAAEEDITILYTNDIHTYIDKELGYSELAAYKDSLGENVLLVDAGDHIQGTAYGSMDKGKTIIELMNAAGYDLATLGNHEFDYGMDGRIKVTDEWAKFPYVSANFYHEKDGVAGESVLDAYKVFEVAGLKIAFVGITTPESFTKSTPAYFQDENGKYIYGIAGGTDGAELYAAVQKAIDAASAEADVVIALGHLGDDKASQPWTSEELIANTTGLDAFIDGHSHSTVAGKAVKDKAGNDVWLTQTGEYFGAIGKMTIKADGTIATELVTSVDVTPHAAVKAIEDAWIAEIDTKLGEVIGSTELTFDNYDANGNRLVRKQETNTGDFAADALYYLFDNMGLDVDVAIMNGGGVRSKAITGEISYKTAKEIHTFGNVACLQTISGQQLLDALEWGAKAAGGAENGGFLHVSGITYDIDTSVPSTVQQDEKGVWAGAPTGEYRVKNVKVYNKETGAYEPLKPGALYNLAGYNYTLRDLGDGFAMFDGAVNVLDYVMEDYMVLANYVKGFEGGKVAASNSPLKALYPNMLVDYSTVNGSGRIVVDDNITTSATILYTNDVHTYIDGELSYSKIAALKNLLSDVVLVDAGDHIQGTAYGSMDKGETIIELMNAAGYDLATLGNHEFDYGMDGRIKVTDEWAKFPYVSANFYHEKDGVVGETVLDAYKVIEAAGLKIAFVGITTPESFTKSTPAYFQDANGKYIYGIAGGEDGKALYAAVQAAIDAASAEADVVIALGHLGDDKASQPWTSEELIANTTGLDAFIDGHSHSTVEYKEVKDKAGNAVVLTQTGEYFGAIGQMTIAPDGTITTELLNTEDLAALKNDADVKAIEESWIAKIDTMLGEVIGKTDLVFDNYDADGNRLVRKVATNTGAFAADALYYLFDDMGLDVDMAIMNGGGVRNKAITGEISYKTAKEIHTFGNVACLQTITGQQLLDALEWGAKSTPDAENGGFLHVSAVQYEIYTAIKSTVQADDKGVWIGAPTGEYRVKNVKVYNKETGSWDALDLNGKYNLAGYNYTLRDLGDGFAMFDGAVNVLDYVMEDYMVLANYVKGFEGGVVDATNSPLNAKYKNLDVDYSKTVVEGRSTAIDKEPAPETGDAGVAVYMAMALIALGGAAVLVAKKKETV